MGTFLAIWLGQVIALVGSRITAFALSLWVYQRTGSTMLYGMAMLAIEGPDILFSPLAGALADRWSRRHLLIVTNVGGGICSLYIAAMLWLGTLPLWTLFVAVAISSAFNALEFPTFSALATVLVPSKQLGRASGFVHLGWAIAQIVAPMAGTALLSSLGLAGILVIDVMTFAFAVCVLLLVRMPPARAAAPSGERRGRLMEDMVYGFHYIGEHPRLLRLLALFFMTNFNLGVVQVVITPVVLGFAEAKTLGLILSVGGLGMLLGSGLMIAWGGGRRPIWSALLLMLTHGVFLLGASVYRSALLIGVCALGMLFTLPIVGGCSQVVWQRRVPVDIQGRVFAVRALVARASFPIAYLAAGPLLEYGFEPPMQRGGALAGSVGRVLGAGPGRGGALLLAVLGAVNAVVVLATLSRGDLQKLDDEKAAEDPPTVA